MVADVETRRRTQVIVCCVFIIIRIYGEQG